MLDDFLFDEDCVIDACMNEALVAEFGMSTLHQLVIVELRAVQRAPRIAPHSFFIDGETVYLRRIGAGVTNGRVRGALMLAYTLHKRIIEPLWVFKAADPANEQRVVDSGPLGKPRPFGVLVRNAKADGPVPETVERHIARELQKARRRRKH